MSISGNGKNRQLLGGKAGACRPSMVSSLAQPGPAPDSALKDPPGKLGRDAHSSPHPSHGPSRPLSVPMQVGGTVRVCARAAPNSGLSNWAPVKGAPTALLLGLSIPATPGQQRGTGSMPPRTPG